MDIRQHTRLTNVGKVTEFVGRILDKEEVPIFKEVIEFAMDNCGVSKKTATEYSEIAFRRHSLSKK